MTPRLGQITGPRARASQWLFSVRKRSSTRVGGGKIAWVFPHAMGTDTLFRNLQDCAPPELSQRSVWIGLTFRAPAGVYARLPLPYALRSSLDLLDQATRVLRLHPDVSTLIVANLPPSAAYLPLVLRYSTYFYVDLTPSLVRELRPWYDELLPRQGLVGHLQRALLRIVHRRAHGVFTWSTWAAGGVRRDYGVSDKRIHVAPPGANLRRWSFVDRAGRGDARPVRILMVGRSFLRKGGELLLEWAARTTARSWELDLVTTWGDLPEWVRARLGHPDACGRVSASLSPQLPGVRVHCGLAANTPELLELYIQADVFCLPTLGDASPIAIIEAMASGLPVLVSALAGIPELVRDGETGVLMRPGDVRDLVARLDTLIGDSALRVRLGRAARDSCDEYFNVERLFRQIVLTVDQRGR